MNSQFHICQWNKWFLRPRMLENTFRDKILANQRNWTQPKKNYLPYKSAWLHLCTTGRKRDEQNLLHWTLYDIRTQWKIDENKLKCVCVTQTVCWIIYYYPKLCSECPNCIYFQYCRTMRDQILESFNHRDFSLMVVGNKYDLVTDACRQSQVRVISNLN